MRHNLASYCLTAFVVSLPVIGVAGALSEDDNRTLTTNLQAISKAWVQEAVDSSNPILWRPEYTRAHWQKFFSGYFRKNPFTGDLLNYLGYPVFGWGPDAAHVELQEGIAVTLQELTARLVKQHGDNLGDALNKNPVLLETLCKVTLFMNKLAGSKDLTAETRKRLYRFHLDVVRRYRVFQKGHVINIRRHPYLGRIRGQLYMNLVSFPLGNVSDPKARDLKTLPMATKSQIARAIHLTGERLEIWRKHSVLIVDNAGLDRKQVEAIRRLLELVPPTLHNLGVITVVEFLGEKVDWTECIACCVNIGGVRIGSAKENGFPDDVPAYHADVFWLIWAHEFNHVVDFYYVGHDDPYRKLLIEDAGAVSQNYLRSMCGDDAFVKGPQEFFASISNQYFANSLHTLKLGLVRFDKGIREPLQQFLFFADVYSLEGDQTFFYTIDTRGKIDRQTVPLTRDANGFINSLRIGKRRYRFVRDKNGEVVRYTDR